MYIFQEVLPLHCSYNHVTMLPITAIPNLPETDQLHFIRKDTDVAKSTQSQFSLNEIKRADEMLNVAASQPSGSDLISSAVLPKVPHTAGKLSNSIYELTDGAVGLSLG